MCVGWLVWRNFVVVVDDDQKFGKELATGWYGGWWEGEFKCVEIKMSKNFETKKAVEQTTKHKSCMIGYSFIKRWISIFKFFFNYESNEQKKNSLFRDPRMVSTW